MTLMISASYGRHAIFIDGANFHHTLRDLNLYVDFRRLLSFFHDHGNTVHANYYTPLLENGDTPEWLRRLVDWLSYNGYLVVTRPARLFRRRVMDENGVEHWANETKGHTALEMVVDAMTLAPRLDTLFLFTGNGDFLSLVQAVQRQGCHVVVISSSRTADSTVADELRRQADEFWELSELAPHIQQENNYS